MDNPRQENREWIYPALILVLAALLYSRSLFYGPVNWDDKLLRIGYYGAKLEPIDLLNIFKPNFSGTYQPVRELVMALLAHQAEKSVWWPYHLVSLIFYLGTILFFYLALKGIFSRIKGLESCQAKSWGLVAATGIFALHPGHVESVAWLLGQKDVLAGFFYLGAFYFYSRSEIPSAKDQAFSLLFYFLALGSKPSAVSLPFVLFFYDLIFRPPFQWRRTAIYSIYLLPAIAAVLYFLFYPALGGPASGYGNLFLRWGKISGALAFSSWKLFLPVNLCLRYPAFNLAGYTDPKIYFYSLLALFILYWTVKSHLAGKYYVFFLIWALFALLPNANLALIRIERADRYYYLSSIGFCSLAGYGVARLRASCTTPFIPVLKGLFFICLGSLSLLTYSQIGYWRDGPTAWKRVLSIYPDLVLARVALGNSYLHNGEYDQALEAFNPLLESMVPNTEALKSTAHIYLQKGQKTKAFELLSLGNRIAPQDEDFMGALAGLCLEEGKNSEAEYLIRKWLQISPESRNAWFMLAELFRRQGRQSEAAGTYERVLAKNPNDQESISRLAMVYLGEGLGEKAESILQQALNQWPGSRGIRLDLAYLYSRTGRENEAREIYSHCGIDSLDLKGLEFMGASSFSKRDFKNSLKYFLEIARREPALASAFNNAGVVYERMGRIDEADSMYKKALELDPVYVDAFFNRGNVFSARGDMRSALSLYLQADSLAKGWDKDVVGELVKTFAALGDNNAARRYSEKLRALDSLSKKVKNP
jgi:tetratricopeptide (TPR) repeat protein